jgi:hypothetical protein
MWQWNSDDEDEYDDDAGIVKEATPEEMEASEENVSALAKIFLSGEEYDNILIIEAAGHHILQSKPMWGIIKFKTKLAIESIIDKKRHTGCDQVIVCDFAHNLQHPHFGGEQPWYIYYLALITINLFDIIYLSTAPNNLTCYIYKESTSKKGSNNVSAMLIIAYTTKIGSRRTTLGFVEARIKTTTLFIWHPTLLK